MATFFITKIGDTKIGENMESIGIASIIVCFIRKNPFNLREFFQEKELCIYYPYLVEF